MPAIPLLRVEGDAYACGLAHGRRFAREIADNLETYLSRFAAAGLVRDQAFAKAQQWLKAITAESPAYADEMRGIAEGCGKSESDRKSTSLNSSHLVISYAVFCLKK